MIWRGNGSYGVEPTGIKIRFGDSLSGGAWQNHIDVIHECCGDAVIVFDKFHIVRHLIEAIDEVHKMEANALAEAGSGALKGTKYIWLKNPWNLTDNQKLRLSCLKAISRL